MSRYVLRIAFAGLVLPALLAAGSALAAEYYQWTDDKGNVHISNSPPPGGREGRHRRSI